MILLGGAAVAGFALWQHNFLFFVFALIATGLMLSWGMRRPRHFDFKLDREGVHIDGRVYPYREFDGFAVGTEVLQLSTKSPFRPRFSVIIPEEQEEAIHLHLLAFLPEVDYDESFIEALSRMLRF